MNVPFFLPSDTIIWIIAQFLLLYIVLFVKNRSMRSSRFCRNLCKIALISIVYYYSILIDSLTTELLVISIALHILVTLNISVSFYKLTINHQRQITIAYIYITEYIALNSTYLVIISILTKILIRLVHPVTAVGLALIGGIIITFFIVKYVKK